MSNFSGISKTASFSAINNAKNAGSIFNFEKAGADGYFYDSYLTYDEELDPLTGLPVYYNGMGELPTFVNVQKS